MSTVTNESISELKSAIRNVPDFPKPGVQFKDITTLINNPRHFNTLVDQLTKLYAGLGITKVCCVESRGFLAGSALAYHLNAGVVPIRKPGKLPAITVTEKYTLEYGEDALEIHDDALEENDVVLIHDDLLATGGTARAVQNLVNRFEVKKVYMNFIVELDFLKGREKLVPGIDVTSLIHF